jgi:hypothetical protein
MVPKAAAYIKEPMGNYPLNKIQETSPWTRGLTTRKRRRNIGSQFEPMIDYKYPTIASGATPIGSAERAPDRK